MRNLFTWQKNLAHAFDTHDVVILYGNVGDYYIICEHPYHYECTLDELLTRLLYKKYGPIFCFDPYEKASKLAIGDAGMVTITPDDSYGQVGFNDTMSQAIARIMAELESDQGHQICMFKYMHNILPYKNNYSQDEQMQLIAFQRMIKRMRESKKLLLQYLSETQVPIELATGSPNVTLIKIPMPELEERVTFFEYKLQNFHECKELAKLTEGLSLTALRSLVKLAENNAPDRDIEKLTLTDWKQCVNKFKFGENLDYYSQISFEDLEAARTFFIEKEGIKGQDEAVKKVIQMLWKARTNVSSLIREDSNTPKGILFFCGPSGTGKTMSGKKLAKFLFGSEDAFHRFDMSEYQQEHTVSKLIGSPPGYVGYEMGGSLTNAVTQKPFSVFLFDEIEKAHPRIFDLFLQILSDGRLTDSRGQTVFFSEAVIIFTSNLGTRSSEVIQLQEVLQSGDREQVRGYFIRSVQNFFRYEISRPELLNRIGNNIVPFNFMDEEDVLQIIVDFYLNKLQTKFDEEYSNKGLSIEFDREAVTGYIVQNYGKVIKEFGGRAVINTLEDVLLVNLAQRLLILENKNQRGMVKLKVNVSYEGQKPEIVVR